MKKVTFFLVLTALSLAFVSCEKHRGPRQLFRNGSFESIEDGEPRYWGVFDNYRPEDPNSIELDTEVVGGDTNLFLTFSHTSSTGCYEMWVNQTIANEEFITESDYRFTMKYKANFDEDGILMLFMSNNSVSFPQYLDIDFQTNNEWETLSFNFTLPDDMGNDAVRVVVDFCVSHYDTWSIDDLTLTRLN